MIKKVAVLTSGGDAPGMNATIRSVIRTCTANDIEVYGIYEGYYGLYYNKIKKMTSQDGSDIVNHGGTFLGSARFPEFKDKEVREKAIKNLDIHGIQALVVIGGDGSYMGAKKLSEMGYPCIGVPGTIDNDAPSTDFTIGFDTALNTIVQNVDRLRDTSASHKRCSVVEVMGRGAGDLALWSGISSGAEFTLIPEMKFDYNEIIEKLTSDKVAGKKNFIVIVAEGLKISEKLKKEIEDKTGIETRLTVLGHIQRGGVPTPFDRTLGARLGSYAVELLMQGKSARCVGIIDNKLVNDDILVALDQKHKINEKMYNLANKFLNS